MEKTELIEPLEARMTCSEEGATMESEKAEPRQVDALVMPLGHLPDFEGKPVLASCVHCTYCTDESDGPEYGPLWSACKKEGKKHMSNLKGFPFRTAQKCCSLNTAFLVDWAEELRKLVEA